MTTTNQDNGFTVDEEQIRATAEEAARLENESVGDNGQGKKKEKRCFKFTRSDLLGFSKPEFVIDKLIERDCTGQIFADVESYKSFLAIEMACCVGTDTPFFGLPVKKGPVLVVIGEGAGGISRRLAAWSIARGVSRDGAPIFVSAQAAQMTEDACLKQIIEAADLIVEEYGIIQMIVIDTLSRNFGAGSENDPRDMGAYVANTNLLRERYRCAVISVHHPGQAAKDRSRGHYTLIGSLDFSYRGEKDETGTMRLVCQKMKEAEHPAPMAFRLAVINLGVMGDDGRELTSCVLSQIAYEPPPEKGRRGTGKWQVLALEMLGTEIELHRENLIKEGMDPDSGWVSVSDWRKACEEAGMTSRAFWDARKSLREAGSVTEDSGRVFLS